MESEVLQFGYGTLTETEREDRCAKGIRLKGLGAVSRDDRDGPGNRTIVREDKYALQQGIFFESHPVKPGLWRFRARADDIISFTTAEKLNPSTMDSYHLFPAFFLLFFFLCD
ncbi:NRPS-like protein biosynthetic cluster [Apiospora hydei]|uniref:NRPS-like protein biosynthetic cluster n=1 Tax=Apiospora hydei TaxID=1337664 RepID=A0ABR1XAL9_9PEZI